MILGKGSITGTLTVEDVQQLIAQGCDRLPLDGKRVLVIIPDGTCTAPIPLFFRLLYEQFGHRAAQLDYLIALGTYRPMSPAAIDHLVGATAAKRAASYPNARIFNHAWDEPQMLQTVGVIPRSEAAELS